MIQKPAVAPGSAGFESGGGANASARDAAAGAPQGIPARIVCDDDETLRAGRVAPDESANSNSPLDGVEDGDVGDAPTRSLPIVSSRPITSAGRLVAARITSCSGMPRLRNFDIVVARSPTGPLALRLWRSVEIVSGQKPAVERGLGDRVVEAAEPVPGVEDQPFSRAGSAASISRSPSTRPLPIGV